MATLTGSLSIDAACNFVPRLERWAWLNLLMISWLSDKDE
jgi:hypothetical protein